MSQHMPSISLALIVIPLVMFGLFLAGSSAPAHAVALQPTYVAQPAQVIAPTDATTHTLYLPFLENHRWVTASLQNGGFEADWSEEESHECLVFHTDGAVTNQVVGNIFTPPGWLTWFKHGLPVEHEPENTDGWAQPEVRDARDINPDRMHSGTKGQLLFTFWRVHDAGFLQQVDVITGQSLRLNGWAHAWSNNGSPRDDFHDPTWSEGSHVGYNHFFALEGTEGLDNGDRNFTFWLGIDPTGGTNPYADTVIWGQGAHIYNAYQQVPSVMAVAQADTVTVFLRSRTLWRFQHNDAYWDDILLEVVK